MDFENERNVISAFFKTFWEALTIVVPTPAIQWNNLPFTQPNNLPWCRFNLIPINTQSAILGGSIIRSDAIMAIQIFIPGTQGTTIARQLADAIANKFNLRSMQVARGWIHFKTLTPEDYGHNDGFYQLNANIPFWRDTRLDAQNADPVDGGFFPDTPTGGLDGGSF